MGEIQKVGIVGDGQLGRMLTEAALPMGYEVTTLGTAGPNSPAAQVGASQLEGALTDSLSIAILAQNTDVVTWEIEHINAHALIEERKWGRRIEPSPESLQTIQDKYHQKVHFKNRRLPVAPFQELDGVTDLHWARTEFGGDLIVKTRTGGYDGRGNYIPRPDDDWTDICLHFADPSGQRPRLYAEQIIPFQRELAVIGVRDFAGHVTTYPVVETVHANSICHMVFAPAEINSNIARDADELGRSAIKSFNGAGVFAVEMFQDEDDNVLINEVAPRVHNSGHFSIEGSQTSQFENHIRAITKMRIGPTAMRAPAAVMINILGTRTSDSIPSFSAAEIASNVYVHGYGKTPRAARKIGHITVLADTMSEAKDLALAARATLDV